MKLSKIIFISCALLLISSASVIAQGNLLDKGESGSSLIYGYTDSDNATITQGSFVVTAKGVVDFGITLGSINPDGFGDNLKIFGLHLELFPIRESAKSGIPINLSIFGIWTNHDPNNSNSYGLGGSVFKKIKLGSQTNFVPGIAYTKVWPFSFDNDPVNVTSFNFPLIVKVTSKVRLSFTWSISDSDVESGTSMFIGITFMGQTKKTK